MKTKKLTANQKIVLISVALAGVLMIAAKGSEPPQEKRKAEIASQFSPSTGENYKLTELVKATMNDPESYKNIETRYWDIDTAIIVNQQYTGTNQFGGRVRGFVKALVSNNGTIQVIESR